MPPIPGVIVIPGDIGFLDQFFSVMLMVGNVAPAGSNLIVTDLKAEIVLPPGVDTIVGSRQTIRCAMGRTDRGEVPRIQPVVQPGADGALGTADDVLTIGPGRDRQRRVPGRRAPRRQPHHRDGDHRHAARSADRPGDGRAARAMGAVLVRNPTFTLTFTHPEIVTAGEPYTLDVTVTNTSASPANLVSLTLYPEVVSGATIVGDPIRHIDTIAPGDSRVGQLRPGRQGQRQGHRGHARCRTTT